MHQRESLTDQGKHRLFQAMGVHHHDGFVDQSHDDDDVMRQSAMDGHYDIQSLNASMRDEQHTNAHQGHIQGHGHVIDKKGNGTSQLDTTLGRKALMDRIALADRQDVQQSYLADYTAQTCFDDDNDDSVLLRLLSQASNLTVDDIVSQIPIAWVPKNTQSHVRLCSLFVLFLFLFCFADFFVCVSFRPKNRVCGLSDSSIFRTLYTILPSGTCYAFCQ